MPKYINNKADQNVYSQIHDNNLTCPIPDSVAVGDKIELSKKENCNNEMQIYQILVSNINV